MQASFHVEGLTMMGRFIRLAEYGEVASVKVLMVVLMEEGACNGIGSALATE